MEIHYCDTCGIRVSEEDLRSEGAILIGNACFCRECAPEARERFGGDPSASTQHAAPPVSSRRRRQSARVSARAKGPGASPAVIGLVILGFAAAVGFVVLLLSALSRGNGTAAGGGAVEAGKVEPRPAVRPEEAKPEPEAVTPSRKPLGENLPTPKPEVTPEVEAKPEVESEVEPSPEAEPVPSPEPEPKPESASEEWVSIFNGRDLEGWQSQDGRAYVEDGALVSANNNDLVQRADWLEYVFEFEVYGESKSEKWPIYTISLCQYGSGRGSNRVKAAFHRDGDLHVREKGKRIWKSGGGAFPIGQWTKIAFEVRKGGLTVFRNGEKLASMGLDEGTAVKGGVGIQCMEDCLVRFRNLRVKVLSR